MSELKAETIVPQGTTITLQMYPKSEVDKVFAEKEADYKEACDRLQTANLIKDEQLAATRHHKYKRCLDKAKWCYDRWIRAYNSSRLQKARFYAQWQKRWEALADKFKEAK